MTSALANYATEAELALREQQCSLYPAVPPPSPPLSYVCMRTTVKHHVAGTLREDQYDTVPDPLLHIYILEAPRIKPGTLGSTHQNETKKKLCRYRQNCNRSSRKQKHLGESEESPPALVGGGLGHQPHMLHLMGISYAYPLVPRFDESIVCLSTSA
uniref:Uncharacterized protein n=1 Tax=Timema cristinae TaxID=61476 RepID=A0A7R9CBL2_TIMCR|nr:unnamed protein product [Timema cristinae]